MLPVFTLDVGFDRGNERTNIAHMTMQGNYMEYEDSSMIDTIDEDEFDRFRTGTKVSDDPQKSSGIISTFKERTYILGGFAMEQKRTASTDIGNRRRYYDDRTLISLLSYSSLLLSQNYPNITSVNLSVVMSVPIQTYDKEIVLEIKKAFNGTHQITCRNIPYTFNVNIAEVLMEGTGAAIIHGQRKGRYALIDGGRLTHNIMIFDGIDAVIEKCKTLEIGVQQIADRTKSLVYKAHQRTLTHKELEEILWAYANKQTMPLIHVKIGNQRIPVAGPTLQGYVKTAIKEVGQDVCSQIAATWSDERGDVASDIHKAIYVGGAALYMKEEVEKLLGTTDVPSLPQRANARGNATRALALRIKNETKQKVS